MLNNRYPPNLSNPPPGITTVEADFYTYKGSGFDLVICNQVLEHVPDPGSFAKKLLRTGSVVVASVPYDWKKVKGHLHQHIKERDLLKW